MQRGGPRVNRLVRPGVSKSIALDTTGHYLFLRALYAIAPLGTASNRETTKALRNQPLLRRKNFPYAVISPHNNQPVGWDTTAGARCFGSDQGNSLETIS